MLILRPHIFNEFPEIICGFSTRSAWDYNAPYGFNLSISVGDDKENVTKNRKTFFNSLGLSLEKASFQKQVHGDKITYVSAPGNTGESDAMITDLKGIALCISTADCTSIFIYDRKIKLIAAIHSGWRGTHNRITEKTVRKLVKESGSDPVNLFVYLGPSISQENYEVGKEVAELFDEKYIGRDKARYFLDVSSANYDMLLDEGIPGNQIQKSSLCSFEYKELLHSYRRDGKHSGRALGIIAMKETV